MTLRFVLRRPVLRLGWLGVSFNQVWRIEHLVWRDRWLMEDGKRVLSKDLDKIFVRMNGHLVSIESLVGSKANKPNTLR